MSDSFCSKTGASVSDLSIPSQHNSAKYEFTELQGQYLASSTATPNCTASRPQSWTWSAPFVWPHRRSIAWSSSSKGAASSHVHLAERAASNCSSQKLCSPRCI